MSGVSLRGVARAVGVSHMAPYNHFRDRAALVAAVAARGYDALTARLSDAMERIADHPARQLQEAGIEYVRFAVTHPALFRLMFSPELAEMGGHPELAAAAMRTLGVLSGALDRAGGAARGVAPAGAEAAMVPLVAWSLVHGVAVLLLDGHFGAPATLEQAERHARAATDLMWYGLRSGAPEAA
ncbi:MAG: WHG domain-containing protein [Gemmatimonadetes bacterium]|nr:WHG domain-containing protein [Gemmatimonadota bacterium]